jgi:hypothetical protein
LNDYFDDLNGNGVRKKNGNRVEEWTKDVDEMNKNSNGWRSEMDGH